MKGMIEVTGIWIRNLSANGVDSQNEILVEVGDSWRLVHKGIIPMSCIIEMPRSNQELQHRFPILQNGYDEETK